MDEEKQGEYTPLIGNNQPEKIDWFSRKNVTIGLGVTAVVLFVVAATVSDPNHGTSTQLPFRSVILLRHCARSTPLTFEGIADGFEYLDNYTNASIPKWPVETYQCLARGLDLVSNLSATIGPTLTMPLTVWSDEAQRDKDTSEAFLRGLKLPEDSYSLAPALFDPFAKEICSKFSPQEIQEILKQRWKANPPPTDHEKEIKQLQQKILGKGAAPPLDEIKDRVSGNYFGGGSYGASVFAEVFMMQLAGGLEVAWRRFSSMEAFYDVMKFRIYYRGIQARAVELAKRSHSNMLSAIMQQLNTFSTGTTLLVGHDADVDAIGALLDLKWHALPFPPNSTTPGAGLRFDYFDTEDRVQITQIYSKFEDGKSYSVPVTISTTGSESIKMSDLKDMVSAVVDLSCVESKWIY